MFDHDVWAPVEPTIAGVVWEMVETGDLVVPRINGEPWVEKPPFYYWLAWATSSQGGLWAGTLRLPSALLGLACLGILFLVARRSWGHPVALGTTLVGATSAFLWDVAHRAGSDISVVFSSFLCLGLFARLVAEERRDDDRVAGAATLTLVAALAISFFAKNLLTLLVVLPPIAAFLAQRGEWRRLLVLVAMLSVALPMFVLPWLVAIHREVGWEAVRSVLFDNTLGRFLPIEHWAPRYATGMSDALVAEKESAFFYLPRLLAYPAPWTGIFIVAFVDLVRRRRALTEIERFLLVGAVTMPLALSLSSAKSTDYLVPVLFFDVLIVGAFLDAWRHGGRVLATWEWILVGGTLVAALLAIAISPLVLSVLFGGVAPLLWAPLALAAVGWLARRARRTGVDARWLFDFGLVASAALVAGLAIALPALDREKSYAPFFEEVQPWLVGRRPVTTYRSVMRLPLINYFLRTRVEVLEDVESVVRRLASASPTAAFLPCRSWKAHKARVEAAGSVRVVDARGRGSLCFVANHPDWRPGAPSDGGPAAVRGGDAAVGGAGAPADSGAGDRLNSARGIS